MNEHHERRNTDACRTRGGGDGSGVELRERLAEVMAKHCEGYAPAYFLDYRGIDDVLTEIEAAGYVLVHESDLCDDCRDRANFGKMGSEK